MLSLVALIREKDGHIQALQEKLHDIGGSYFPRKHKDALEEFELEKWREEKRKEGGKGGTGWEVFERWEELGVEGVKDWEEVVGNLGNEKKVVAWWMC